MYCKATIFTFYVASRRLPFTPRPPEALWHLGQGRVTLCFETSELRAFAFLGWQGGDLRLESTVSHLCSRACS